MMKLLSFSLVLCALSATPHAIKSQGDDAENVQISASSVKLAAPRSVKLMSSEREALYRKCLPRVDQPEVARLLADPALILYSDREMPKAYQFFDGAFPGVHHVSYNISANGSEPFGNGNREFPWSSPAGTHRAQNVTSFRFLLLPHNNAGKLLPVVWHTQTGGAHYAWTYPVGTVFGEVLMLRGPEYRDYTFELRLRRREAGSWDVDVLRPFPTAESLLARIRELRPDWKQNPSLVKLCSHLEKSPTMPVRTLADQQPQRRMIQAVAGVDMLPAIEDSELVKELLTGTTFHSASGTIWRQTGRVAAYAPTTTSQFHIVPANYDAGFISVDSHSCQRCHSTTNQSVRRFNASRDWYGHIRGSDGIFSFHPFDPSCISGNGYSQTVRMRSEFTAAGILERYDPAKHSRTLYNALR